MANDDDDKKRFYRAKARLRGAIVHDKGLSPAARLVGYEITDMVNYDTGFAWPSQGKLSADLGLNIRTVRRAANDLDKRYFTIDRDGRSYRYRPIWVVETSDKMSGPIADKNDSHTGQKVQTTPDKKCPLSYLGNPTNTPPPPNPPSARVEQPSGYPAKNGHEASDQTSTILPGEVLGPEGDLTFDAFWRAVRQQRGPSGPALAAWRKLTLDDRRAIGNLIGANGIDLDNVWVCTWLAERRWSHPSLRDDVIAAPPRPRVAVLPPYSPEWITERDRKRAAGESVKLMEDWANDGRAWEVAE